MSDKVCIYGLIDPRGNRIKYIGQTIDIERRYKQHCSPKKKTKKDEWIRELLNDGLIPALVHLETVSSIDASNRESWWIQMLEVNSDLTNMAKPSRVEYDYGWLFDNLTREKWIQGKKIAGAIFAFFISVFVLLLCLSPVNRTGSILDYFVIYGFPIVLPPSIFFAIFTVADSFDLEYIGNNKGKLFLGVIPKSFLSIFNKESGIPMLHLTVFFLTIISQLAWVILGNH